MQKNTVMEFSTLKIQLGESVAWVSLNRPEVHNAMNDVMIQELTEVFDWLDCRDDVRVIMLKGNGKSFCAGADLAYMRDVAKKGYDANYADAEKLSRLFRAIYFCRKVVVCVVQGACMGGANGLVSASDIVIADKGAFFAFPEVLSGLIPATISPFVVQRCGMSASRELMLTGRRFTAEEAKAIGIVNVLADDVPAAESACIEQLMKASPEAVASCKRLLQSVAHMDDPEAPVFELTSAMIAASRASADAQEGTTAFLEKRKPSWCQQ